MIQQGLYKCLLKTELLYRKIDISVPFHRVSVASDCRLPIDNGTNGRIRSRTGMVIGSHFEDVALQIQIQISSWLLRSRWKCRNCARSRRVGEGENCSHFISMHRYLIVTFACIPADLRAGPAVRRRPRSRRRRLRPDSFSCSSPLGSLGAGPRRQSQTGGLPCGSSGRPLRRPMK